jgi:hypothetical protein
LVYNTIGNLLTQADQVRCFENAAQHLSDDGVFVLERRVPSAPSRAGHLFVDAERVSADRVTLDVCRYARKARAATSAGELTRCANAIGVSVNGYTCDMASRHRRIQVPCDPELNHAIARARGEFKPGAPSSEIVHALAVRGAQALEQDREAAEHARAFLISVAEGTSGLDLERLRDVRDRAW